MEYALILGLFFLIWMGTIAVCMIVFGLDSKITKITLLPFKIPEITIPLFVPVVVRHSFVFFVLFLSFIGGWQAAAHICLVYLIILIHEFSHSIVAIQFGYKVSKIELWPLAGMAHLEGKFYKKPYHEFYIGVAGPGSNVIMGLLVWPIVVYYPSQWFLWFLEVNVIIGLFNMLPIFPMDGGRILRSTFTSLMGDVNRATAWACNISLIIAVLFYPFFWMWNPLAAVLIGVMALLGRAEKAVIKKETEKDEIDEELLMLQAMSEQYGAKLRTVYNEARSCTLDQWQKLDYWERRIEDAAKQDKELYEEIESRLEVVKRKINSL